MAYIEREAFRKKLAIGAEYLDEDTLMTVVNLLDCEPAADVAPVVRCKDCIHWLNEDGMDDHVCLKIYSDGAVSCYAWQERKPDDFCSYGERKDGEG
jgi:hypothetical protein